MKKNLLSITTILIMIVALFISCSNEVQTGDKVSKVLFTSDYNMTRGLNSSSPAFDVNQYYWTYEAQKMDNSGLKTGETEGSVPVIKVEAGTPEVKGLGVSVGPFSLGTWKFILQAHEGSTSGNILYTGVASNVVITDNPNGNKVSIKVHSLQSSHGYVEIAEGIGLKDSYGNPVLEYTEQITFSKAATPDVVETLPVPEGRVYTVPSGSWKVTIAYLSTSNPDIAYGRNSIYVNVFDNQKVVIGGSLEEITGNTSFETTVDGGTKAISAPVQVTASAGAKLEVSSSPAAPESTAAKTEIQIPANALKADGSAKLSVTSYDSPVASKVFTVADNSGAAVAALDIDLHVDDAKVSSFDQDVTVNTFIAKNLPTPIKVVYNGGDEKMQPRNVNYVPETGALSFLTNHFSQFYVVSDVEAMNKTTGAMYKTFAEAMANYNADDIVVLLKDCQFNGICVRKNLTLDLNGHEIIMSGTFIDPYFESNKNSKGASYSRFQVIENSKLRIIGAGRIESSVNRIFSVDNAEVEIEDGIFVENGTDPLIFLGNKSIVTINGGSFYSASGYPVLQTNGNDTVFNEITINDGFFGGAGKVLYMPANGNVTIRGGKFEGRFYCIYQKAGILNISGGDFTSVRVVGDPGEWIHNNSACVGTGDCVIVESCGYPSGSPEVNITGGTFNGYDPEGTSGAKNYGILILDWYDTVNKKQYATEKITTNVPFGYAKVDGSYDRAGYEEKWWTFNDDNLSKVAIDGAIEVSDLVSLNTAFKNVNQGQTIRLMADISHDGSLVIPQDVTIDYNGHKISDLWDGTATAKENLNVVQ